MSTRNFYPDVFPGTRIDFSNRSSLPPDVEFNRGGIATYADENGIIRTALPGEPRFTYDVATGESLGLLVEESGTNLQPSSSDYTTNYWNFSFGITKTPNATIAPDGTLTATLIQQDTTDTIHVLGGGYGFNSGYITLNTTYTLSLYVKYYNSNKIRFMELNTYSDSTRGSYTKAGVIFNFETESIEKTIQWNSSGQSLIAGYKVDKFPDGWYRLSLSVIPGGDSNNQRVYFGVYPQEGNLSAVAPIPSGAVGIDGANYFSLTSVTNFVGDGSTGVYIWGAQVEAGSFSTSYIPTSGSAVTRAADTFSAPVSSFKSSRIIFSPANISTSNSISSPTLTFSDSSSPTPPYSLELSTPSLIPTLTTKYNSVPQSYLSIPAPPAPSSPPPEQCSIAFNYNSTTGAMGLATSAGDDASTTAVVLPEEYNIPAPAGYALDTVSVSGSGVLKEIYAWNTELDADQLASVAKEFKAIGRPAVVSSGLQDDTLYDVADARPTLDLNFAKNKNLVNSVNDLSLVSFSRASKGTYVDEDGIIKEAVTDEPRFDHDPNTLDSLGLLVEEERTNLVTESVPTIFSPNNNVFWRYLGGISSPYATLAPDNTLTAAEFTYDGSSTDVRQYIKQVNNLSAGTTYVGSIFIKSINATIFSIGKTGASDISGTTGTFNYSVFDLSAGTATSSGTDVWIEPYPNGWYKCSFAFVANTNTIVNIIIYPGAGRDFYFWGGQIEKGSFPTSYIPTPATFISRASNATYYDANGIIQTALTDVARDNAYFPDENGIFRPAGLVLEAVGTNIYTRSQAPISADVLNTSITLNSASAPDNTSTAIILEPTGINSHGWAPYFTGLTASTNYTLSLFVKAKELSRVSLGTITTTGMVFDASTGQIISGSGTVQKLSDGWYRCSCTIPSNVNGIWDTRVYILDNSGNFSYTANGTDGIYFWGFQLELGSYPTSYIPTSGSQGIRQPDNSTSAEVIRRADVAEITGTNFSSWFNQSEGTIFTDSTYINSSGPGYISTIGISDGIFNGGDLRIFAYKQSNMEAAIDYQVSDRITSGFLTLPWQSKNCYTYADVGGTNSWYSDGNLVGSLTRTVGTTSYTTLSIFKDTYQATGHISRLTYWPNRLPDATLQAITNPAIETWDLVFDSSLSTSGECAIITASTCEYNVDWGDGTPAQTISASGAFTTAHTYVVPKKYNVRIEVVSGAFRLYYSDSTYADQLIEVGPSPDTWSNTSTSGFGINLSNAFYGANNLKTINTNLNLSGTTALSNGLRECRALTTFPLLDTSAITDLFATWYNCVGLTSFPLLNTSNVTNFGYSWFGCSGLTEFPLIDTSKGTSFNSIFRECSGLIALPLLNTSIVDNFTFAWYNCSGLTSFPLFNTSNGINFSYAWFGCSSLTNLPPLNTSSGTNFFASWYQCTGLTNFPSINTSLGTNFGQTWRFCSNLTSFPLLDFSSGTNFSNAWGNCTNLTTFPAGMFNTTGTLTSTAFTNAFTGCALSAQSIENILVSLDTNGQSGITLGINGGTNASKSTWSAIAVSAYDSLIVKGWTISFNP